MVHKGIIKAQLYSFFKHDLYFGEQRNLLFERLSIGGDGL